LTRLIWNHACTVGVKAMDDQAGILVDAVNELRLAVVRGSGRESLRVLLDRIVEFSALHFVSEERLMEQSAFPGLGEHHAEHKRLLAQLRKAARSLECEDGFAMGALLASLREGFTTHIGALDRQYGPWLNERGIR
jgi:hemerythrin